MRAPILAIRATESTTTEAIPTAAERYARERFERHVDRLRVEIKRGSPRASLDACVRTCVTLLESAGEGRIVEQYRAELRAARNAIVWHAPTLRVVR